MELEDREGELHTTRIQFGHGPSQFMTRKPDKLAIRGGRALQHDFPCILWVESEDTGRIKRQCTCMVL
jgi:hypothetical protein